LCAKNRESPVQTNRDSDTSQLHYIDALRGAPMPSYSLISNEISLVKLQITIPTPVVAIVAVVLSYLAYEKIHSDRLLRQLVAKNQNQNEHEFRRDGRNLRRPPFLKRISSRFRTRKRTQIASVAPIRVSLTSQWLPEWLSNGIRGRDDLRSIDGKLQSTSLQAYKRG